MEIRRRLNASGAVPRHNQIWSKATIAKILAFEGYGTGKYTTVLDGDTFTTACPQIIPLNIWEKSIEVRNANKKYRGRNVKEDYLCRGMVTCLCNWAWTARTSRSKGQTGKCGYYGCARKDHQPERVHKDCPGTIGAKKLDAFVWNFVVNLCNNPDLIQDAIDAKIALLQQEADDIEFEAERLQKELNRLVDERQWVITTARKGKISDDDMEIQLAAIDLQTIELRREQDEKLAAILAQKQADRLKEWANQYLSDMANGLRVLETNPAELDEEERENLFSALGASRFEEKYEGDRLAALQWAILEEKRRTVRMIVSKVLLIKGQDGSKQIIPQLEFDIPPELASLVYDDQSLAYVESAGENLRQGKTFGSAQ